MKKRTALAIAAAGVLGLTAAEARAGVLYDFKTTNVVDSGGPRPYPPLTLAFDLTRAVVQQGSFTLKSKGFGTGAGSGLYTGDVGGFSTLSFYVGAPPHGGGNAITPSYSNDNVDIAMSFDFSGNVTSSRVSFLGISEGATIAGTGMIASGAAATDDTFYYAPDYQFGSLTLTGLWTQTSFPSANPIPEPASFAVLGAGVLGLGMLRRRNQG